MKSVSRILRSFSETDKQDHKEFQVKHLTYHPAIKSSKYAAVAAKPMEVDSFYNNYLRYVTSLELMMHNTDKIVHWMCYVNCLE